MSDAENPERAPERRKETKRDDTGKILQWFQVAAVIIGAAWVVLQFWIAVLPGIQPIVQVQTNVDVSQERVPFHNCELNFTVTVTNGGGNRFTVGKVEIRDWLIGSPNPETARPELIDQEEVTKAPPLNDIISASKVVGNGQQYLPKAGMTQLFPFVIKASQTRNFYLFRADVFGQGDDIHPIGVGYTLKDSPCLLTAQKIAFPPLQLSSNTYSGKSMTAELSAFASSQLPVTYTVSGPAQLGTDFLGRPSVTINGAGIVKVVAHQDGNENFAAAAPVEQRIEIALQSPGY